MTEAVEETVQTSPTRKLRYTWVVICACLVNTIVGSGIVKDSVKWAAFGGSWAFVGVFALWLVTFLVSISMSENASIIKENGGVYIWAKRSLGRFWGIQVGGVYLVAYSSLSVIMLWLTSSYTMAFIGPVLPVSQSTLEFIQGVIVPLIFVIFFAIIYSTGKKLTTQTLIGFFTIKTTMWFILMGIGLIHGGQSSEFVKDDLDLAPALMNVATSAVWAMLGLDTCSVITGDIHKPGKNMPKGVVAGMIIVLVLYLTSILMVLTLAGQSGAEGFVQLGEDFSGIGDVLLSFLSIPPVVVKVFIVISISGTTFITFYIVIRIAGAMRENNDFFRWRRMKYLKRRQKKKVERKRIRDPEIKDMPRGVMLFFSFIYIGANYLIFYEGRRYGTGAVFYMIYYTAILATILVLMLTCLTNIFLHKRGIAKEIKAEKGDFRLKKGTWAIFSIAGIFLSILVIFLIVSEMFADPDNLLPQDATQSYAWKFWGIFARVYPVSMVLPGILIWALKAKRTVPEI
ncbi:MAG: APC family permease [Candidatus Hodarchaeota archaeon]